MNIPRSLALALGVTLLSIAPAVSTSQAPTPAAVFRESAVAARGIPTTDATRIDLLRRVAQAEVWFGDVDSALALSQPLGAWRREVQADATCHLLEDQRFDDAYRLVRRFPNEDRDWALAGLAVRLARPPVSPRRATPLVPIDFVALRNRALSVAREIRSPEVRVDAFLEIGSRLRYQQDTPRARAAVDRALASLSKVRDRDLASSRLRMIVDLLASVGYTDSARALLPSLLPQDRIVAARTIGQSREPPDRATATLSTVERAVRLAPNDYRAAVALVDTLDDRLFYGRRARAFARVALAASKTSPDTAALLLGRARELALAPGLSPRQLSLTLLEIAKAQIGRGLVSDGAATFNAIPDRAIALAAFDQFRGLRLKLSKADGQRFLDSLGDEELRAAAAARVIDPWIGDKEKTDADFVWATSVVDSLPRARLIEAAEVLVARAAFFRGDTAAARNRSLSVLRARDRDWTRWPTHPFGDQLIFWVVRSGGLDEALAWARALPSPASRAAGLLEIGDALEGVINMNTPRRFSDYQHACRDDF